METLDLLQAVARRARVLCCSFEILDRSRRLARPHAQLPGEAERTREPGFVIELLKDGDGIRKLAPRHLMTDHGTPEEAEVGQRDVGLGGHAPVARCACLADGFRQNLLRPLPLTGLEQRPPEGRQEAPATSIAGGQKVDGTGEEAGRRSHVAAGSGLRSRRRQPLGGSLGELPRRLTRRAELDPVAIRPLEVVADDLVELDEIGGTLGDPAGEARVQVGAGRFRERLVGRVADQQVAEAKGVLSRKLRAIRAQQFPANERRERRHELGSVRRERLDCPAVEHAPLDRAAPEHVPLDGVELIEPRGQQGLDRRRHGDGVIRRLAHERDHLLDEERIAFRRVQDPRAQRVISRCAVEQGRDECVGVGGRERLEQHRRRIQLAPAPVRPAVEQLGPCHAEQENRRITAQVGDVVDEIEERLLAPVDVVQYDDERGIGSHRLQQHPHRPGDLLDRGHHAAFAEHGLNRPRSGRIQPEAGEALLRRRTE